ncbi:MAG: ATP-binding protein [Spirochaetales bacterium]|nr:ATP-binding protein [Spirochaetales bacterium]
MWIDRKSEILLEEYKKQFPVVLITGSRQVGKTSLLTHGYPEAHYISLDNPQHAANADNFPGDFIKSLKTPVIIDEAQYAPGIFRYLKILIDKLKTKGMYFITGSQHFPLMHNVTESLAGRCGIIQLHTLSAKEVFDAKGTIHLEDFIIRGGFPALHSDDTVNYLYWYPSYITTYLERDVRNIVNITSLRDFNRLIRALAARTGQILSLSQVARDVGVSPNTVKSWLSILQTSGHIYLLEPYYRNIGKRLVKSPKLYFCDTGLAVHLLGIYNWEELQRSPNAGAIWETYVFNQIYRYFINKGQVIPNLWFWRTNTGDEVDFLIEKGGQFHAVECKLTANPGKHDNKGLDALKTYYGEQNILKSTLACKVDIPFMYSGDIFISNFIDCDPVFNPVVKREQ